MFKQNMKKYCYVIEVLEPGHSGNPAVMIVSEMMQQNSDDYETSMCDNSR